MVGPTQLEIDTAVMVAKNATYKLAYELALERKYGGNIDCCVTKLKLLWLYKRALSCQKEYINSQGALEITLSAASGTTVNVFINDISISGVFVPSSTNVGAEMVLLADAINNYQTDHLAYFDLSLGNNGKITIVNDSCVEDVLEVVITGEGTATTRTKIVGGVCASNCLTDEKAKKLIAKINSMCNKQ